MRYGRDFIIYFLVNALSSAVPILLLPFLTKHLTTSEFGTYYLIASIVNFLTPLIGLCVHGAILTYYTNLSPVEFRYFLSNLMVVFMANSILMSCLIISLLGTLSAALNLERHYILAAVGISLFQYTITIAITFLQASRSADRFFFLQSTNLIANLSLTVLFVFIMNDKLTGRIVGWITTVGFGASVAIIYLIRSPGLVASRGIFRYTSEILKFAAPLIPHTVGGLVVSLSDRWIIAAMIGKAELGAYSISQQIASILGLVLSSTLTVYNPWLFAALKKKDKILNQRIVFQTYMIIIFICVVVPLFWLASSWLLPKLTDSKFHGALKFLPYHALAFGFNGMYYFISGYFFYSGKTLTLACITMGVGLFQVLACIALVSTIGALGAAVAQCVSFFLLFVISFFAGNRVYPMPWAKPKFSAIT